MKISDFRKAMRPKKYLTRDFVVYQDPKMQAARSEMQAGGRAMTVSEKFIEANRKKQASATEAAKKKREAAEKKRIAAGSGEKMKKKGAKGAPTAKNFAQAKKLREVTTHLDKETNDKVIEKIRQSLRLQPRDYDLNSVDKTHPKSAGVVSRILQRQEQEKQME